MKFFIRLSRATAEKALGSSDASLHVPTILSFLAILIAGMQGMLALESTYPCRISTSKLTIFIVLQIVEIAIVFASEVISFIGLANALQLRLTWLQWTPICVLVLGLVQLSLDAMFTMDVVAESRVNYRPISARSQDSLIWELFMFVVTLVLSVILIGWRQGWWWVSTAVSNAIAKEAAEDELALSTPFFAVSVAFAFVIIGSIFIYVVVGEIRHFNSNSSLIRRIRYIFASDHWQNVTPELENPKRYPGHVLIDQYRALSKFHPPRRDYREENLPDDFIRKRLWTQPLRIGNLVVGDDMFQVQHTRHDTWGKAYRVFVIVEDLMIVPLMIVVVAAVARLHSKLDAPTFEALRHLSEVVIVVAFLDLAISLKNILWKYSEKPPPVFPERKQVKEEPL